MDAIRIVVPLHITGFWRPIYADSPLHTGSIGAGINLSECLIAEARISNAYNTRLNGKPINIPPLAYVLDRLKCKISMDAWTRGVLGAGFGLSGALALAASIAGAILCREGMTLEDAAARAHVAEVVSSTGLGDVIAEYYGGFEVRVKPGPPGIGAVIKIPVDPSIRVIAVPLGVYETKLMLASYGARHAVLAKECLDKLLERPDIMNFIELSQKFTRTLFDYSAAESIVSMVRGFIHGYYFKKRVLVMVTDRDLVEDVVDRLRRGNIEYIVSRIRYSGVEVEEPHGKPLYPTNSPP